jgi:hypothetical protein
MGLVEQSTAAAEVLRNAPLVAARIGWALDRLRIDIMVELMKLGHAADQGSVDKIINGLPPDVYYREVAART